MPRNARRPHDDAGYRQRRKLLMESITPATRCMRCGKLASQHPQRHKSGKPAGWQCGHTVDGDNRAPLALEWSTCNLSAGGRLGYARGLGRTRAAASPNDWPAAKAVEAHYPGHYDLSDPASVGAPPCVRYAGSLCPTCVEWRARNS